MATNFEINIFFKKNQKKMSCLITAAKYLKYLKFENWNFQNCQNIKHQNKVKQTKQNQTATDLILDKEFHNHQPQTQQ